MSKALSFLFSLFSVALISGQANDLMIIEYVDWDPGSGWALKIYNPTGQSLNLSNYYVKVFNGNNTTASSTDQLSGTLAPNSSIIIGNPQNSVASSDFQACTFDLSFNSGGVNDDDCIAITLGNTLQFVDMVGLFGVSVKNQVDGTPNALKWQTLYRDIGNCTRYTSTDGTSANSWPNSASVSLSGWTVNTVGCLQPGTNYSPFSQSSALTRQICPGDSTLVNGRYVFDEGIYTDTTFNASGCGVVQPVQVEYRNQPSAARIRAYCPEDSVFVNGQYYRRDTLLKFSKPGPGQCDSLVEVELTAFSTEAAFSFNYLDEDSSRIAFSPSQEGQQIWLFGDGTDTSYLGDQSVIHQYGDPGNYSVKLINISENGCRDSIISEVFIPLQLEEQPSLPNVFTPNGDGINELYTLLNRPERFPFVTISIYNRNGQLMYRESGDQFAWDGTRNGQDCPTGTYFYLVEGLSEPQRGFLTLAR